MKRKRTHHTCNNNPHQRNTDQCLHGKYKHNVLCTRNGGYNYRSGSDGNSDR